MEGIVLALLVCLILALVTKRYALPTIPFYIIAGLILGIIFVLISTYVVPGGMSLSAGFLGIFGIFIVIILYVIIFIVGAFIGDWLEGVLRK